MEHSDVTNTKATSLPVVDLSKASDPAQRQAVAKQLVQALETVGFLFLDHVKGFDAQTLLANTRWFFGLSDLDKRRVSRKLWNPESSNHYRGYFPLQPEEISYKEGFEIGQGDTASRLPGNDRGIHPFFVESNLWPEGAKGVEQFKREMLQHYQAMLDCGSEILRLVSLGWGMEEDWFHSMFFPDSLSTLRLLHYPPRTHIPVVAKDGDTVLSCSEHSDSGFVTLLATFRYGGLQIRTADGRWWAVPCRPDSLVMNIGDMLSAMSGGKFKATNHRVVDTGQDRFSVPFFFEPCYYADVTKVMPSTGCTSLTVAVKVGQTNVKGEDDLEPKSVSKETAYGPWLIEKMRSFSEYREILDCL